MPLLSETPDVLTHPSMHHVFVEKTGPFSQTARHAWNELHKYKDDLAEVASITGACALYKMNPDPPVYRAGFILADDPSSKPAGKDILEKHGLKHEQVSEAKYAVFTLQGSYHQLPEVSGRVWEIARTTLQVKEGAFAIENHVTDPNKIPEDELITKIMVPVE